MIAIALIVIRLADVKSATTRNGLYGVALVKATITLAGFGILWPVAGSFWPDYQAQVLPPSQIGPVLLIWAGAVLVIRNYLANRALLSAGNEVASSGAKERADQAVERVMSLFQKQQKIVCQAITCSVPSSLSKPTVMLSSTARTPAISDSVSPPALVLPVRVVEQLDDAELEGIVAHEIAHVVVNGSQQGCAPGWARFVRWGSPLNVLFTRLMRREEELACDEVASRVTGNPEALASALLKTHRMSRADQPRMFAPLASLTIQRRFLRQRVSALLELGQTTSGLGSNATRLAWITVLIAAAVL
jgi:beta-lactamase regulating signal transducer with metallopeptidase domain